MIHHDPDTHPVNRVLIEYAFRQAGIVSTNTSEQDVNMIKAYTVNATRAQIADEAPPEVTDELAAAVERTLIRSAARGETFNLAFGLAAAVEEKKIERSMKLISALNPQEENFLNNLIGMKVS